MFLFLVFWCHINDLKSVHSGKFKLYCCFLSNSDTDKYSLMGHIILANPNTKQKFQFSLWFMCKPTTDLCTFPHME